MPSGRLQPRGNLPQGAQLQGQQRRRRGALADGEVSTGAGLDRIGLFAAEQGGTVVLVALRIAARHNDVGVGDDAGALWASVAELLQEVHQVVGILPGGIEPDDEGDLRVTPGDVFETLAELLVAGERLSELQLGGGWLLVACEESGVVAEA